MKLLLVWSCRGILNYFNYLGGKMKKMLLFLVAVVILPAGTASAVLTVYEYKSGEKVTKDTKTGNHWYWNLYDFTWKTYGQQITAIDNLNLDNYGNLAGGWHMPTKSEIDALLTYTDTEVINSFNIPQWPIITIRYDHPSPYTSYHRATEIHLGPPYHIQDFHVWDGLSSRAITAWATTGAAVIPVPPAVVLASTGLLCLLGAKLMGRRR